MSSVASLLTSTPAVLSPQNITPTPPPVVLPSGLNVANSLSWSGASTSNSHSADLPVPGLTPTSVVSVMIQIPSTSVNFNTLNAAETFWLVGVSCDTDTLTFWVYGDPSTVSADYYLSWAVVSF